MRKLRVADEAATRGMIEYINGKIDENSINWHAAQALKKLGREALAELSGSPEWSRPFAEKFRDDPSLPHRFDEDYESDTRAMVEMGFQQKSEGRHECRRTRRSAPYCVYCGRQAGGGF